MTILIVLMALMIVLAGVATSYGLEYLLEARKSTGPVMLRYVLSEDQRRSLVSFFQERMCWFHYSYLTISSCKTTWIWKEIVQRYSNNIIELWIFEDVSYLRSSFSYIHSNNNFFYISYWFYNNIFELISKK